MTCPIGPWKQVGLVLVALFLIGLGGCASVRPVETGGLYRSGQLSAAQLDRAIDQYDLKTVINLRGPDPDRRWYREQQEVCQRHGVKQVDVAIGTATPSEQEIQTLLATYREAPRPMLVHSWSSQGSVGLASALYRVAVMGEDKVVARKELAPWTSYRWPVKALSEPDRYLRDWQGAEPSLANRERTDVAPLPDPLFDRVGNAVASRPSASGGWSEDEKLPPPAMEYFRAPAGGPPRASQMAPSGIQPVVWLGSPEGIE
jgi:protein tyrosine phosphatase (PTP) superfamily phosphohydrolase (DUF442 family)